MNKRTDGWTEEGTDERMEERADGRTTGLRELDIIYFPRIPGKNLDLAYPMR